MLSGKRMFADTPVLQVGGTRCLGAGLGWAGGLGHTTPLFLGLVAPCPHPPLPAFAAPSLHPPALQVISLVTLKNYRPPIPEDCPAQLAELVQRCWQADPSARQVPAGLEERRGGWGGDLPV